METSRKPSAILWMERVERVTRSFLLKVDFHCSLMSLTGDPSLWLWDFADICLINRGSHRMCALPGAFLTRYCLIGRGSLLISASSTVGLTR